MASEQGPIATDSPLAPPPAAQAPAHPAAGASDISGSDHARLKSLKRARETTPTAPGSAGAAGDLSPAKIARLATFAQSPLPAPLTGAAALEDERRRKEEEERRLHPPETSQNPTQRVLSDLIAGANVHMSRPQDGPAQGASVNISRPHNGPLDESNNMGRLDAPTDVAPSTNAAVPTLLHDAAKDLQALAATETKPTSPQSTASAAATMASGNDRVIDSPTAMDVDARGEQPASQQDAQPAPTSYSYPGILPSGAPQAPSRGMSLPMAPAQNPELASRSPSAKKHKCPYCETEFTRQHNLKSHLLTHSQEKPYLCQTCNMRFRRLHDLKRHSKLHTGEKPHICPKCDRKFARADALARHSKGAGGCAGRRSSMGSFGGDDDYEGGEGDDSTMTGIIYDAAEADLTEEERRRLSLPSIKAQHVAGQAGMGDGYTAHARNTYPPVRGGGLLPPRAAPSAETSPTVPNSTGSGHTPNTSISSMPLSAGSSLFSQTGMTESPKPLSPGVGQPPPQQRDGRSGSLQQQIASRQSEQQHAPPQSGLSAPPPHGAAQAASIPTATATDNEQPQAEGSGLTAAGGAAAPSGNLFATAGEQGLWTYIHSLEEKVKSLGEELASVKKVEAQLLDKVGQFEQKEAMLANELALLRTQLAIRAGGAETAQTAQTSQP